MHRNKSTNNDEILEMLQRQESVHLHCDCRGACYLKVEVPKEALLIVIAN